MEPYVRAYLQLLMSGADGARAEVFVFATRLTRLTRVLRGAIPEIALQRAGRTAPDWSGGTRIGTAIKAFNDRHGRRGLARGGVIVVLSDGWDRGDPEILGREMARLHRLAFRVVWVNPRKAAREYAPLVGGMAAALPHADAFISGHSLAALEELIDAIRDRRRRTEVEAGRSAAIDCVASGQVAEDGVQIASECDRERRLKLAESPPRAIVTAHSVSRDSDGNQSQNPLDQPV